MVHVFVGSTELSSEINSVTTNNNFPNNDLKSVPQPATTNSDETSTSDTLKTSHNDKDLLSEPSGTEADLQQKATDYGIKLSHEDQITLLLQTTDSKLSDIR